jgi:hypothetical protein
MTSFELMWFSIWIVLGMFSFLRLGYRAWFRTSDLEEEIRKRKQRSPKWFKNFAQSTSISSDVWTSRIISATGFLLTTIMLIVLIAKYIW